MRSDETYLVGGITVLDNTIGADDDSVNIFMLEEGADHGVACNELGISWDKRDQGGTKNLQIMQDGIPRVDNSRDVRREP